MMESARGQDSQTLLDEEEDGSAYGDGELLEVLGQCEGQGSGALKI